MSTFFRGSARREGSRGRRTASQTVRTARRQLMAVRKFRTVEDMEQPYWRQPGDPLLYRTIARLWEFGRRTSARHISPGVYRHRTIEDLNAQTEAWAAAD